MENINNKELIKRLSKMCPYIKDTYNDDVIEVTIKALQDAENREKELMETVNDRNIYIDRLDKEINRLKVEAKKQAAMGEKV